VVRNTFNAPRPPSGSAEGARADEGMKP
jgi:hypothetical protein